MNSVMRWMFACVHFTHSCARWSYLTPFNIHLVICVSMFHALFLSSVSLSLTRSRSLEIWWDRVEPRMPLLSALMHHWPSYDRMNHWWQTLLLRRDALAPSLFPSSLSYYRVHSALHDQWSPITGSSERSIKYECNEWGERERRCIVMHFLCVSLAICVYLPLVKRCLPITRQLCLVISAVSLCVSWTHALSHSSSTLLGCADSFYWPLVKGR